MTRKEIRKIIHRKRGAAALLARTAGVNEGTVSKWFAGHIAESERIETVAWLIVSGLSAGKSLRQIAESFPAAQSEQVLSQQQSAAVFHFFRRLG